MLVALDHARMRKLEDLRDVFVGHGFEQRDADHMETDDDARNESHERNNHHQPLDVAFAHLVDKGVLLVLQETDHEVSRQRDEDRVDEKEVERPDEEFYLPRRQTEARRAEGRYQRRGDRHTGDNGRGAVLPRLRHDTGQTAEQGDQHVVGRRHRAGQQLAAVRREGRHEEIDRRGDNRHDEHQRIVAQRLFEQLEIVDAQRKADAHNRAHDRRNEHGADNYGRRIDVQAERRDHRRKNQHPKVHPAEHHALADGRHDLVALRLVFVEAEVPPQEFTHLPHPERERAFYIMRIVRIFHFNMHYLSFIPLRPPPSPASVWVFRPARSRTPPWGP